MMIIRSLSPADFQTILTTLQMVKAHAELNRDLEKLRGSQAWAGVDLKMPDDYWHENFLDNALIAKKPD